MSTLGRKAMKKTLERLKGSAFGRVRRCCEVYNNLFARTQQMTKGERELVDLVWHPTHVALLSLAEYIKALEEYGYELDEAWDKLFKAVEETQQRKPSEKESSYRI